MALRVGPVGPNELGFYVDELRLIVVHPDLTPDELFDTLAHEVVHAIRRDRGDGNGDCGDEDEVDRLAQEMFGPYRAPQPANA